MSFHHHTLKNGLTIIGEAAPQAHSVAVGFFVRTGSRDETPQVCGVSHFLEHMAFKGSARRTAEEVNRDFDRIGADYNAFTSEENTVYHASVLPEYLPQALDIVADLLCPVLRQEDFDVEKKVIINEIGRYEDMPMWSAFDHAKTKYFGSHNLGNSILGTPESITAMERDEMEAYYRRRYVASNIVLVASGKFDFSQIVQQAEQLCGGWPAGERVRGGVTETVGAGTLHLIHKPKVAQQYVVLMGPGPAAASPLRHASDLLGMVIGDDTGSRLYWELVDPGYTDSAGCGFHEYDGTGVYYTSMSCEPDRAASNTAILKRILAEVQEKAIRDEELATAKCKLLSQLARSAERPRGRLVPVGLHWTCHGEYRSVDDTIKAYDAVTLDDVREVIARYPLTKLTTLTLGPLESLES